jgi:hypothetical protein
MVHDNETTIFIYNQEKVVTPSNTSTFINFSTTSTTLTETTFLLDLWSVLIGLIILFSCVMALYGRGLIRCIKTKTHRLEGYHDIL